MEKKKNYLQKAMDLLEGNGFHVSRIYEENNRDAGNVREDLGQNWLTGAIIVRIVPDGKEETG
jgi:hypothetical protein